MRVVVAGQGRVGLPLAVRAAEVGHRVVGYDVDERLIKRLTAGGSCVEDVPAARLRPLLESGAYRPSTDPADVEGFEVALITVPVPLRDGAPDLSLVESSARLLARHLRPGATVVLESTSYPGTTEELLAPLLEEGSGLTAGQDFHLGCSPGRIDQGDPARRLENTPKVVSGLGPAALAAVDAFYRRLVERTVPVSSCRQAELTQLLECGFRQVNTALVNELAMFAHDLGLDLREAIDAAATRPFGHLRPTPGPGAGGPCLPIDPGFLPWRAERALGQSFRLVELANEVNGRMPDYVVRRLTAALAERGRPVRGARILLFGAADGGSAGDTGVTPVARIVELLTRAGAEVRAADPDAVTDPYAADDPCAAGDPYAVAGPGLPEPVLPRRPAAGQQPDAVTDPYAADDPCTAGDPYAVAGPGLPEPVLPRRPAAGQQPDAGPFAAVPRVAATAGELAAADAVVLLTEHPEFDLPAVTTHARYVLDCRRRPAGATVEVL